MPFDKEQLRAYRKKLYDEGICVKCHSRPRSEKHATCEICRKNMRERNNG